MKSKILFLLLILGIMVFVLHQNGYFDDFPKYRSSQTYHNIQIVGDEKYVAHVTSCLDMLRKKSPASYVLVTKHVARILQHERSGINAWADAPTFKLSARSAYYSKTWCAGVIAHDAYHVYLYRQYKPKNGDPTPQEVWAGFAAERKCNAFQLKAMQDMDAPQFELDHLQNQDGTHADINRDGKVDWDDYELRDW